MFVERLIRRSFYQYGQYLAHSRWLRWGCFLCPLVITAMLATQIADMFQPKDADPIRGVTPESAPSWQEQAIIDQYWPIDEDEYVPARSSGFGRWVAVSILSTQRCPSLNARGDCNLLQPKYIDAVKVLERTIAETLFVTDEQDKRYLYDNANNDNSSEPLCLSFWQQCVRSASEDGVLALLANIHYYEQELGVKVGYPIVRPREGNSIFLGSTIHGVETFANNTIKHVSGILLFFPIREHHPMSEEWELEVLRWLGENFADTPEAQVLDVTYRRAHSVHRSLRQAADRIQPYFIITFSMLLVFCMINLSKLKKTAGSKWPTIDRRTSKPWLAFAGIITAALGIASGNGLVIIFGGEYGPMMSVIPFLIISIGVDDMFIMVAAWQTADGDEFGERLANALADAACAITITSVTSALSFGVGALTDIPVVRNFCAFAATDIAFNYIYQITFFASCLAFFAERETSGASGLHCMPFRRVRPERPDDKRHNLREEPPKHGSDYQLQPVDPPAAEAHHTIEESMVAHFFKNIYGPRLLHPVTSVFVAFFYAIYIVGAIWGCTKMNVGLVLSSLILPDDPSYAYMKRSDIYGLGEAMQIDIVFNEPGDLSSPKNRERIERIVHKFESSKFTLGPETTQFWMRSFTEYMQTVRKLPVTDDPFVWSTGVKNWVSQFTYYKTWGKDIVFLGRDDAGCDADTCIKAFRLRVTLDQMADPLAYVEATKHFRALASQHTQHNITIYHLFVQMADQLFAVPGLTLQTMTIALACMAVVSLLLIPSLVCTAFILLSLVSIDIGVAGYLFLWHVRLDQMTMITLIMSVGFAVDYSAHIIYGFVNADQSLSIERRCIDSMQKLAWPVFQGGLSTLIGVSVLPFVNSYMITSFFKTIFLVITLGVVHALVFIPVLISRLTWIAYY